MVLGDLILDCYLDGAVARVSPEAPVAVLDRRAERLVPGGAANVACNIAAQGGQAQLFGAVGDDDAGRKLVRLLQRDGGLCVEGILVDSTRPTTTKTRVMSGRHQLLRIDNEQRDFLGRDVEERLAGAVETRLRRGKPDVIVVSDYAKGVCTDQLLGFVIDLGKKLEIPVIVDPKRRDFDAYKGATLITPNRQELSLATGLPCEEDPDAERAAGMILSGVSRSVLLTRSERGMSFYSRDAAPVHVKTAAREVFDVSGAGDTVVALIALGMAARQSMAQSMRIANLAAGIAVGKVGTTTVSRQELDAIVEEEAHHEQAKGALVQAGLAVRQREIWRRAGLKVGFTNGCFDILHPGHAALLEFAADKCDRLIVGLNSDASIKRLKGPSRPVQSEAARARLLGCMRAVDLVVIFDSDTPEALIRELKPDLLVKGADYRLEDVVGRDVVEANGGEVVLAPLIPSFSTTSIIDRMNQT